MGDNGRATAYADLLSALLALRSDPATARFDSELAAAEAAGALDGTTARTLLWWQRESLRGVADHLTSVLPDLLGRLAEADEAARLAVDSSSSSWSSAIASSLASAAPLATSTSTPQGPGPHLRPVQDLRPRGQSHSPLAGVRSGPMAPAPLVGALLDSPPSLRPGFAPESRRESPTPADATATAPTPDPSATPEADSGSPEDSAPAADLGAPPRRLLVAGLTVLSEPVHPEPDVDPRTPDDPVEDDPIDPNDQAR